MDHHHADHLQSDLAFQLPRDSYHQVLHSLRSALPPPPGATPDEEARHDNALIARIACVLPANADEANLATQYIAAQAQSLNCLRLAGVHAEDPLLTLKFSAQAASMMREARAARGMLLRVQAARQKREADGVALDRAAWTEHCAIGLMADALGRPRPAATTEPQHDSQPEPPAEPDDKFARLTEAEQYAVLYPRRAALIRSLGGLPPNCGFGPPEADLVQAILASTSPTLRALDAFSGN